MAARHSQDQAEIAELVPQVSGCDSLAVDTIEQRFVKECSEQIEVTGLRLVETGHQPIDYTQRRSGLQTESGPSLHGTDLAVAPGGCLQRANDGGAHGNHARRTVDSLSGGRVHGKPFFEQWMLGIDGIILERAQAGMQDEVGELDPVAAQLE